MSTYSYQPGDRVARIADGLIFTVVGVEDKSLVLSLYRRGRMLGRRATITTHRILTAAVVRTGDYHQPTVNIHSPEEVEA